MEELNAVLNAKGWDLEFFGRTVSSVEETAKLLEERRDTFSEEQSERLNRVLEAYIRVMEKDHNHPETLKEIAAGAAEFEPGSFNDAKYRFLTRPANLERLKEREPDQDGVLRVRMEAFTGFWQWFDYERYGSKVFQFNFSALDSVLNETGLY